MSKRLLPGLFVSGTLAVAGYGAAAWAETPRDTIVIAKQIDDIMTLDPAECYELSGAEILTNVYDRLVRYEAEDLSKLVGGVADGWQVSDDGKTFTFNIRPGLKFQDGNPVTAEDVAFSLRRVAILNKKPAFLLTQLGINKASAKDLIKATDQHTLIVAVTADYAPSLVLNVLSSDVSSVLEEYVVLEHEENGDLGNGWLKSHSASSGAYKLVSWKPNESVTLEANPSYRLGAPRAKRVVLRHIPEPATQQLLLKKGDIDIARDLQVDQIAAVAADQNIHIEEFPGSETVYIGLNLADDRLKNPKVQQALRWLVDYDGMVRSFLKGRFIVQQTFLPKGFPASIDYNPFRLDVAKAKQLLVEAGYPNGFSVTMDAQNVSPMSEIAQSIQQTMGQAGVHVEIKPAELKQVYTAYRSRRFQMVALNWAPDYLDPHSNADAFVYNPDNSEASVHKLPAWQVNWEMPDLSKLTLQAVAERDTEKRFAIYAELQKRSTDEGAFIFMLQPVFQAAQRSNVRGFVEGATEDLVFYRLIAK